jgi:hypothetical protein
MLSSRLVKRCPRQLRCTLLVIAALTAIVLTWLITTRSYHLRFAWHELHLALGPASVEPRACPP